MICHVVFSFYYMIIKYLYPFYSSSEKNKVNVCSGISLHPYMYAIFVKCPLQSMLPPFFFNPFDLFHSFIQCFLLCDYSSYFGTKKKHFPTSLVHIRSNDGISIHEKYIVGYVMGFCFLCGVGRTWN